MGTLQSKSYLLTFVKFMLLKATVKLKASPKWDPQNWTRLNQIKGIA